MTKPNLPTASKKAIVESEAEAEVLRRKPLVDAAGALRGKDGQGVRVKQQLAATDTAILKAKLMAKPEEKRAAARAEGATGPHPPPTEGTKPQSALRTVAVAEAVQIHPKARHAQSSASSSPTSGSPFRRGDFNWGNAAFGFLTGATAGIVVLAALVLLRA